MILYIVYSSFFFCIEIGGHSEKGIKKKEKKDSRRKTFTYNPTCTFLAVTTRPLESNTQHWRK